MMENCQLASSRLDLLLDFLSQEVLLPLCQISDTSTALQITTNTTMENDLFEA